MKNCGKVQAPFARKREHPVFDGIRRTDSIRHNSLGDASKSSISKSLSDIWEFESKQKIPNITSNAALKEEISIEESKGRTVHCSNKNVDICNAESYIPQCAATYYSRTSVQDYMSNLCTSMEKLNQYLKASKDDMEAGVPGRYLHAVISQDMMDVGCFVGTIMYAFFLGESRKNDQFRTMPIINMKREAFSTRAELKWLVISCHLDEASLIFIDEVDLSYYEQFGSLKLVLVNGNKLPSMQEGLKETVVEIFHVKEADSQYPLVEEITIAEDCSCCTLLTEMFVENIPEILAGQGFSRLLLSSILLDTSNLTDASCTSKDKYMATLLIKGAGRFGSYGLHQILRQKMCDVSDLKIRDILRREFKKSTRVAGKPNSRSSRLTLSHIGMSYIGISIEKLLYHEDSSVEEILLFQESEKLGIFLIVSGYHDEQQNFKREILVSANNAELMRDIHHFFDINGTYLPIKALDKLDSKEEMKAFEIDSTLTSRRSIERLLEELGGVLRQN